MSIRGREPIKRFTQRRSNIVPLAWRFRAFSNCVSFFFYVFILSLRFILHLRSVRQSYYNITWILPDSRQLPNACGLTEIKKKKKIPRKNMFEYRFYLELYLYSNTVYTIRHYRVKERVNLKR